MKPNIRWPRPAAILAHHRRCAEALNALRAVLLTGVPPESRFAGMNPDEQDRALAEMQREMDTQTTLLLAASFEAVFQVDLHTRVSERRKDPLSKQLRKLWQRRRLSGRLEVEELLEFWKKETGRRREIGELKQLIQYRHWLAHGRYWQQQSGLTAIDPLEAWQRGRAVFGVLPGFPRLPPA
jgi:hypothetical protein